MKINKRKCGRNVKKIKKKNIDDKYKKIEK